MPMQCAYHPEREPVGACVECGRLICVECKALLGGKMYCTPCADKKFVLKPSETVSRTAPIIESSAATIVAPAHAQEARVPSSELASESASGQPAELKGWNWGAFIFTWIWGIVNRVWLSFLVFIPVVNIVMIFILGAKGNEWAWKSRKWDSIEHFKKHQKAWKPWAILLFVLALVGMFIWIIIAVLGAFFGLAISFGQ